MAEESLAGDVASSDQRVAHLASLAQHLVLVKSTVDCLFCLFQGPEHVLACGHALCENCVRIFGTRRVGYRYWISNCLLCLAKVDFSVCLKPPTARPRMLSIDGGGIKGVVALTFLDGLQRELGDCCPLGDFFDLIMGTSSGEIGPCRCSARRLIQQVHLSFSKSSFSSRPPALLLRSSFAWRSGSSLISGGATNLFSPACGGWLGGGSVMPDMTIWCWKNVSGKPLEHVIGSLTCFRRQASRSESPRHLWLIRNWVSFPTTTARANAEANRVRSSQAKSKSVMLTFVGYRHLRPERSIDEAFVWEV